MDVSHMSNKKQNKKLDRLYLYISC